MISVVGASLLLVFLHQHRGGLNLLLGFLGTRQELIHKKLLTDKDSLLINDVVELCILRIKHLFLVVVFLIIFIFIVNIILSLICIDAPSSIFVITILLSIIVTIQLLQDILDLPLELLIALLHQVLQDLWHTELLCFFSQLLPGEY